MARQNKTLFDLSGKYTLITGSCGLLGAQHSIALSKINSNLVLVDIDKKQGLKLKNKLKKVYSNKIYYFNCDITKKNDIEILRLELKRKKIKINILINNASINPQPSDVEKKSDWENSLNVGLTGAKNMIETFSKDMLSLREGNIINIGSDLSVIAPDQRLYASKKNFKPVSYSVVKNGIIGVTKYYASLYASKNVRCNCLSPGGVYNGQDAKFVRRLVNKIPLNRMANKSEYIGAIQFLASDASKYMTGHNLVIDGGRSII